MASVIRTVTTATELRAVLDGERAAARSVGFVPTMGALHDGHASLLRAAAAQDEVVVLSIFVNPLQFAPTEDLDAYPRDPKRDRAIAEEAGATVVFAPDEHEMYPLGREGLLTTVAVPTLAGRMEGASRPTHFAGVCTVVAKLFHMVGPCRAYFGEKDFQQLAILRRMALDLSFPVEVVGCPTRREPDGLAMSSRNVYLSPDERAVAPVLHSALAEAAAMIATGERSADAVRASVADRVGDAPLCELDYVEVVDPATLEPVEVAGPEVRVLAAVRIGRTRLIDNVGVDESAPYSLGREDRSRW